MIDLSTETIRTLFIEQIRNLTLATAGVDDNDN